jgi:hypothetical protein
MGACSIWRLRWWLVGGVAAVVLAAFVLGFLYDRDTAVAQALGQLQPGMTEAEVQKLLQSIRHAKLATKQGESAYVFYGFDEFVTVVMEKNGEQTCVAKVEHEPDDGPFLDRLRRQWERRLR